MNNFHMPSERERYIKKEKNSLGKRNNSLLLVGIVVCRYEDLRITFFCDLNYSYNNA